MNENLKVSYVFLVMVAIICWLAYFVGPNNSITVPVGFKEAFFFNLGISVITILITVFLIDAVIERNRRNEIVKINKIAYGQIRSALYHQYMTLFNLFKATVQERTEIEKEKPESLFVDFYFENIKYADLNKIAPVFPEMIWLDYLSLEIGNFQKALEKTIDRYGATLPTMFIDESESIISSSFSSYITQFPAVIAFQKKFGESNEMISLELFQDENLINMFKEYCYSLSNIIVAINNEVDHSKMLTFDSSLWDENNSPSIGSARKGAEENEELLAIKKALGNML